jgi:signal transduction histidine kinase
MSTLPTTQIAPPARRRRAPGFTRRRTFSGLVAGFVTTFALFIASSFYTTTRLHAVRLQSEDIGDNALPSVVHLSAARNELRRLERTLDNGVDGRAPWTMEMAETGFAQIDREITAYRLTKDFPGENEAWVRAERDLRDAKAAVIRVTELLVRHDAGVMQAYTDQVLPAMNTTFESLGEVSLVNTVYGMRAAVDMERADEKLTRLTLVLDALSLLVSGLIGFFGLRAAFRYTRMMQERATQLEEFAGRVAHDVRGPLAPVMIALQVAARVNDERTQRMVERGERSLKRVVSLVDDLLGFAMGASKADLGARTPMKDAVAGLVNEVEPLAAERKAEVQVGDVDDVVVACAPGVLASILSNLVRNAIKYLGGRETRRVTIRAASRGPNVCIEVEDTGPGIPSELHAKLFEPYIRGPRTTEGGLGLGLATVKRLVEAHGGSVTFRSVDDQGSTFSVLMPVART